MHPELCTMNNEPYYYQLALVTPGISPRRANVLKQMRHMANRRR